MTLSRRSFARALLAAPVAAGLPAAALAQGAGTGAIPYVPMARLEIGRFTVTVLTDGYFDMPYVNFTGLPEAAVAAAAEASHAARPGGALRLSFSQYLIEADGRRILVDTGPAGIFGPTTGWLAPTLARLGITPDSIDALILTHAHVDHIGGTVVDGRAAFPQAEVYLDRRDIAYFGDAGRRAQAPEILHSSFDATARLLEAYPNLQRTDGDHQILPGLELVDLTGHTPGHVGVRISDAGESLILVSDMLFHPVVHPQNPAHGFGFEMDPAAAETMRTRFFDQAAGEGSLIAATHMPFPGLGRILDIGGTRRWVPAEWAHGA